MGPADAVCTWLHLPSCQENGALCKWKCNAFRSAKLERPAEEGGG